MAARLHLLRGAALAALLLSPLPGGLGQARADDAPDAAPPGFWERDTLLGDEAGLRAKLADSGIKLGVQETSEVLNDAAGGFRRGTVYAGQTHATLNVDLAKLVGLEGGTLHVSAFQIHGRSLDQCCVGAIGPVSNIEATRATRLFEAWYEQGFADGKLSLRLGQLAADQEFAVSLYGALFINAGFGWPNFGAADLPSGGPAYPLGTPGARLAFKPSDAVTLRAAVFNGDPAGPGTGDPQLRDASGTGFRLRDGALVMLEGEYDANTFADLPGVFKLGMLAHSGNFADQALASNGVSQAAPSAAATPAEHRGDWGVYALADQLVWKPADAKDGDTRGIGVFGRVMGGPDDRNLVDLIVNAGITWKGMLDSRPDDTAGFGLSYARIGDRARQLDAARNLYDGTARPIRDGETALELTYQMQAAGWLLVQPDLQYIVHPGGNVASPLQPTKTVGNATVLDLRAVVTF